MFAAFSTIVRAKTSADLIPPFHVKDRSHLGYWEIGGATQIEPESIMLAPPIQFHKGHLWTNAHVPLGDWKIDLDFLIRESNGGGGFAIWIIDKYGADGPIYGGPSNFSGVAVHGIIRSGSEDTIELEFQIIQNPKSLKEPLLKVLPTPVGTVQFATNKRFIISLGFTESDITLEYNETELGRVPLQTDLSENFIGITAASEDRFSRIDLLMIQFRVNSPIGARNSVVWDHKPVSYFQPPVHCPFNRPYFNKTLVEFEGSRAAKGEITSETTAEHVLDVIDEANQASFEVASFSELVFFVNDNLLMYGEKWHRRTLKIVERVQAARNVAGSAWNHTHSVLETFNRTLKHSLLKATGEIGSIDGVMALLWGNDIGDGHEIEKVSDDVMRSPLIMLLIGITLVELVAVLLFIFIGCFLSPG